MKFKAALFYQDTLVYYSIYSLGDNYYKAKLDDLFASRCKAPQLVELHRYSDSWLSDCPETELVKELGAAIDQRNLVA